MKETVGGDAPRGWGAGSAYVRGLETRERVFRSGCALRVSGRSLLWEPARLWGGPLTCSRSQPELLGRCRAPGVSVGQMHIGQGQKHVYWQPQHCREVRLKQRWGGSAPSAGGSAAEGRWLRRRRPYPTTGKQMLHRAAALVLVRRIACMLFSLPS